MKTSTRTYRLCMAGVDLLAAFDREFPRRDRLSDGWVGDASHAARPSDHNVAWQFRPPKGVVRALDVDKDLKVSVGAFNAAVERVRLMAANGDRRFRGGYIIWRGRIASGKTRWRWARYRGANGHYLHAHFSFGDRMSDFDARGRYPVGGYLAAGAPTVARPRPAAKPPRSVRRDLLTVDGKPGPATYRALQRAVQVGVDGNLGPASWRAIQRRVGVSQDGKPGPATWRAIQKRVGVKQDGKPGPATWRAIQKTLNDRKF